MRFSERSIFESASVVRSAFLILFIAALSSAAAAQTARSADDGVRSKRTAVRASLVPELGTQYTNVYHTSGYITCKAYSQLSTADNVVGGRELLLDFGGAYSTTFQFQDYVSPQGTVDLISASPTNPPATISVSTSLTTLQMFRTSQAITAVIVRDAAGANYVYQYDLPGIHYTNDGMNLTASGANLTSISFCFDQGLIPSAADVSISGRVLTASGRAVGGALITVTDASTGETFTALTSPFGYYTVEGLQAGGFYIATVAKKGVKFADNTRAVSLTDSLADMDFVATQ